MPTMPVEAGFEVTSGFAPRWGTFHWGTDFGLKGGSGGKPIYAVKDGTVNRVGLAAGFGQWITLDHHANVGGGTSVYGHIIPEVRLGQFVREGQRIGYINPNSATNGNVAPHLHYEYHRSVWAQPGPDRLDPMATVLKNAGWPGKEPKPVTPQPQTIFGVDVSEHQSGMSLKRAAAEGIRFAIIRTTDGTYRDRTYRSHVDDARSAGLILSAYHYLRNPAEGSTIRQQVDASLAVMGEHHRLPIWLDCETDAGLHPNHIREAKRLFEQAGIRVIGCYSYVPWWERRIVGGEPDSHEFGAFWVAAYGNNPNGSPRAIYPGDHHRQWSYPVGNQLPAMWQFGSNAAVAGYAVDINAFRGGEAALKELFTGKKSVNQSEEEELMNALNEVHKSIVPDSEYKAPLKQMIVNADGHAYVSRANTEKLLTLVADLATEVKALREQVNKLSS